jgi:hypothetical protein
MTQPQLVEIQGILTAKHALDWPKGPLTDLELLYALGKVIKDALREGRSIGINETAAHASTRRPIDGILPVLSSHR